MILDLTQPPTHSQSVSHCLPPPSPWQPTFVVLHSSFVRSFVRSLRSFVHFVRSLRSLRSFVRSFTSFVLPPTRAHTAHTNIWASHHPQPPPAAAAAVRQSGSQAVRQANTHSPTPCRPPSLPFTAFVHSFDRLFALLCVRSFVRSFVRAFVRSCLPFCVSVCLYLTTGRTDGRTDRPDDRTDARTVTSSQPTTRRTAARRSSGPPDTTATRHTHPCLRAWAACALCCGSHARGGVITPAPRLACERVAVRSSWARNSRRRHNPPPSTMLRRPSCGGLRTRHSLLALCTHCHRRSVDEHGPSDGEAQRLCRCPRSCACGEASRCYVRAVSCSFFSSASFPVLFFPWLGSSWCLFVLRPALLFDTHAPALFCLFCFLNHRRQEVFP